MKKRSKESRKKLNSLVILIALVAILLITSTYAWFSTQKDVLLSNLKGTVNVAEGLEVSLDGETWGNEVDLGSLINGGKTVIPSEMLPVSTAGEATSTDLTMLRGKLETKVKLANIVKCVESISDVGDPTFPGYFAFDIYLKNTNKTSDLQTTLQLNKNSVVKVAQVGGNAKAGIQNTVRVGFARYTQTVDPLADKDTVIADTYGNIEQVAIWEPNSKSHVPYIVKNNNLNDLKFSDGHDVETFGLKSGAVGNTIADIYKIDSQYSLLQNTVKTNYLKKPTETDEGIQDLKLATNGSDPFTIAPNKISKVRVYVWLEGGDVDCTNYASHGGQIDVTIGLIKDAKTGPTPEETL